MKQATCIVLALAWAVASAAARQPQSEEGSSAVLNAGRGGHNSRDLLQRLDRDVLARCPDLVIIMVGTNDVLNHANAVPLDQYRANLLKLVRTIRAAKSRVMLLTIPPCHEPYLLKRHPAEFYQPDGPVGRIRKANATIRNVAKGTTTPLVDVFGLFEGKGHVGTAPESWLRNPANSRAEDGVHPTAEGYTAIAEAVAGAIRKHRLPHKRVVCFGDSITYGAGVKGAGTATGHTYPACLARLLDKGRDPATKEPR